MQVTQGNLSSIFIKIFVHKLEHEKTLGSFIDSENLSRQFQLYCFEQKEKLTSKELDDGPQKFSGKVSYVGVDRQFFLAALVPSVHVPTQGCRIEGVSSKPLGAPGLFPRA